MFTCIYLLFIFVTTVFGDDNEAKLRLYQGSLEDYTEVTLKNSTDICSNPWFVSNRTTKILIHGFNGKPDTGTAVRTIMKSYLDQEEYNVLLLNWEKLAADKYNNTLVSYPLWAAPNAIKLGSDFADALQSLFKDCLNLNLTHILGHSLGAHVAGIAGNTLVLKYKLVLPWITGLDPTGIIFNQNPQGLRLNPNSACFVDVIHTDPSKYGSDKSMGTVDIWPNYKYGYVVQPGCDNLTHPAFSDADLCNHNRCWQLMLDDQLKFPGTVLGCYAKNYYSWTTLSEAQRNASNILEIGRYDPNAKPGNYYLTTNAASQYGRGLDGIKPDNTD